jgi:hypothetical protein
VSFLILPLNTSDKSVVNVISTIIPFDDLESQHIQETLAWIKSGAQIFRLQKPDIPPKALEEYANLKLELVKQGFEPKANNAKVSQFNLGDL